MISSFLEYYTVEKKEGVWIQIGEEYSQMVEANNFLINQEGYKLDNLETWRIVLNKKTKRSLKNGIDVYEKHEKDFFYT